MRWAAKFRLRLRSLLNRDRLERDLEEELSFHVDRLVDEHMASGLTQADARNAALREMGGVEQHKEECRDARGVALADDFRQDVKYALRALRKSPGFSAAAILSLALGVGANTTIFTFVNAVLLRPLPYPNADRMLILRERPRGSDGTVAVHPFNFLQWRARARSLEALALMQTPPLIVIGDNGAEQIARAQTTVELFHIFGLDPAIGRVFTEDETRPGGPAAVVVLGYKFWQRRFGGDPSVVGQKLAVRDGSLTIIGVAAPALRIGSMEPDAYTPLQIDPAKPDSIGSRSFQCYGLLKRGVTIEAARAEMAVVASTLASEYPLDKGFGVFVAGLHDYLVSDRRLPLLLLMAVVAAVLLIACANLASLLLARGLGRRGELAVRTALGARRERIVRQLVTESLVLSSLGGLAGLVLAYGATRALLALSTGALGIGTIELVRLDSTCLIFTIALSTATALLFGLVPAWQASRVDPQLALREWTRGSRGDRRHQRLRSALVVSEIGLTVVLLISAGLLLRTFSSLVRVNLGFQPASTITMNLFLGVRPAEARIALVDEILDRVEAVSGVRVASTIQFLPLTGLNSGTGFWRDGQAPGDASGELPTECSLVSRGYFAAMGIPVLEGRAFDRQDRMTSPRVVMVNHAFAARYFPEGHVTGRRILVHWSNQAPAEIVGVVGNTRHDGLTMEPVPTVFLLHSQTPGYITNLVVRTTGNPLTQAAAVRRAIQEVDRNQAVSAVKTMDEYLGESLARPRLYAALVATFATLAVILTAVGIYGLLAYAVNQQRHEIGIRFALGATRGNVFRSVFGKGVLLTFGGITAGIFAALGVRGVLSTLLFGVTPVDPTTYVIAAGVFTSISLAAAAIPAHRASRVPPVTALKCE